MNSFSPVSIIASPGFSPVTNVESAYDTITLPGLTVTGLIGIVAEFTVDSGPFALRTIPEPVLPLTVRCNSTRYYLGGPNEPDALALPYEGQTIPEGAIFEYWATGASPVSVPSVEITISSRTGTSPEATLAEPVRKSYPISYPITNA